jgi:hypothetical protein
MPALCGPGSTREGPWSWPTLRAFAGSHSWRASPPWGGKVDINDNLVLCQNSADAIVGRIWPRTRLLKTVLTPQVVGQHCKPNTNRRANPNARAQITYGHTNCGSNPHTQHRTNGIGHSIALFLVL